MRAATNGFLTLKTSSSSSRSSSMLFQLSLGTLITFSTVPLSEREEVWSLNVTSSAYQPCERCFEAPPVPMNMTSYWPSAALTRSTATCVKL